MPPSTQWGVSNLSVLRHHPSCPTCACALRPPSAQYPWALQVGSDLTYVFSTESAAAVIKGYSPELIVMPLLPELPVFPVRSKARGTLHWAQPAANTQHLPVTARHKTMMWGGGVAFCPAAQSPPPLHHMSRDDPKPCTSATSFSLLTCAFASACPDAGG